MLTITRRRPAELADLADAVTRACAEAGRCELDGGTATAQLTDRTRALRAIGLEDVDDLGAQVTVAFELGRQLICRAVTLRLQALWRLADLGLPAELVSSDGSQWRPVVLGGTGQGVVAVGTLAGQVLVIGDAYADHALLDDDGGQALLARLSGASFDKPAGLDACAGPRRVTIPAAAIVASGQRSAHDQARLGLRAGFEALGAAAGALDAAVDYARVRRQFGQPIGSYQGISHALARLHLELEVAAASGHHALSVVARAGEPGAEALAATDDFCVLVRRSAPVIAEQALHAHGAIGFCWEHPAHLWLRRVWDCIALLSWAGFGDATKAGERHIAAVATRRDLLSNREEH
jgi:hypothetical protein